MGSVGCMALYILVHTTICDIHSLNVHMTTFSDDVVSSSSEEESNVTSAGQGVGGSILAIQSSRRESPITSIRLEVAFVVCWGVAGSVFGVRVDCWSDERVNRSSTGAGGDPPPMGVVNEMTLDFLCCFRGVLAIRSLDTNALRSVTRCEDQIAYTSCGLTQCSLSICE